MICLLICLCGPLLSNQLQLLSFIFLGSVFVVDIDKNNKYVVSGGEDDKALIWELASGHVVSEIKCR